MEVLEIRLGSAAYVIIRQLSSSHWFYMQPEDKFITCDVGVVMRNNVIHYDTILCQKLIMHTRAVYVFS